MELTQILLITAAVVGVLSVLLPLFKKLALMTKTDKDDAALEAAEKALTVVRALLDALGAVESTKKGITPAAVKRKSRISKGQLKAKKMHDDLKKLVARLEGRTVK